MTLLRYVGDLMAKDECLLVVAEEDTVLTSKETIRANYSVSLLE